MVEKGFLDTKPEFVASSAQFSSKDCQILLEPEAHLVVVKNDVKVTVFCTKTARFVGDVFKNEETLSIWLQKEQDSGSSILCGLTKSGHILKSKLSLGFEQVSRTPLPSFAHVLSKAIYTRVLLNENCDVDKIVAVNEDNVSDFSIKLLSITKKEDKNFGPVLRIDHKPIFDLNKNILVKLGHVVKGKPDRRLIFYSLNSGAKPWLLKVKKEAPVTCITCHPLGDKLVLIGNSEGKIKIFRSKNEFLFFSSDVHWHSLPIRTLAFSPDGMSFYSGGGEGALLKWETWSSKRLAIVPRIGFPLISIAASDSSVVVATENNGLKIFTATLEDDLMITGLSREMQNSGVFWHPKTSCLVMKDARRRIQFFDPILKTQKLTMEASNQDDILGDRKPEKKFLSKLTCISSSDCGNWLASIESNWDTMNGNCLKIWKFSNETGQVNFECNTRVNGAHDGEISSITFIKLQGTVGLLTFGQEGKAKLWELVPGDLWEPIRTFTLASAIPRCGDCSKDQSVIAISFDSKITLWSSDSLSLLSTLSILDKSEPVYTSLAFVSSRFLVAANQSGVHVWSILSNQLTHKMMLKDPKLLKTGPSLKILCSTGLLILDDQLKMKYLLKNIGPDSAIACSENQCYIINRTSHNHNNELCCIPTDDPIDQDLDRSIVDQQSIQKTDFSVLSSAVGKVKVTVKDDIFVPKIGPMITANMISKPVSRNALSVMKQSLPS